MLVAWLERRDLTQPLDLGTLHRIGVPDGQMWIEDTSLDEPVRCNVIHVNVPDAPSVKGAYLRTSSAEVTVVIAEDERCGTTGELQRLIACVRDQAVRRHEAKTEVRGKMPDMRPGGSTKAPTIHAYVPRSYGR